jgi:hypothetical protein
MVLRPGRVVKASAISSCSGPTAKRKATRIFRASSVIRLMMETAPAPALEVVGP